MDNKIRLTIRLPKELHDALKDMQGDKSHLSLNALIAEIIAKAVKGRKR